MLWTTVPSSVCETLLINRIGFEIMERLIFGEYEITEDLVAPFLQVFQMKDHTGIIADAVGGRQLFGLFFQQIDIFKPYRSGGVLTDQRDHTGGLPLDGDTVLCNVKSQPGHTL